MKTHILIALIALIISACASNRDVARTPADEQGADYYQHSRMIDGQGTRFH